MTNHSDPVQTVEEANLEQVETRVGAGLIIGGDPDAFYTALTDCGIWFSYFGEGTTVPFAVFGNTALFKGRARRVPIARFYAPGLQQLTVVAGIAVFPSTVFKVKDGSLGPWLCHYRFGFSNGIPSSDLSVVGNGGTPLSVSSMNGNRDTLLFGPLVLNCIPHSV